MRSHLSRLAAHPFVSQPCETGGGVSKVAITFTLTWAKEKEMATHSSVLAWRMPGAEEPGGLPSMGSHRIGHD